MPTPIKKVGIIRGSSLIPYHRKNKKVLVFLQKRSTDAKRGPGCFSFFGGHAENSESPEETLRREILEELNYEPIKLHLLGQYHVRPNLPSEAILSIFVEEVTPDFKSKVTINEGEDGLFVDIDKLSDFKLLEECEQVLKNIKSFLLNT